MTKFIQPHQHSTGRQLRSEIKGHRPAVLLFTGLSGCGKSTIANAVEKELNQQYRAHTYLLDGIISDGIEQRPGFFC
jgi:adenylylsulfate kinase